MSNNKENDKRHFAKDVVRTQFNAFQWKTIIYLFIFFVFLKDNTDKYSKRIGALIDRKPRMQFSVAYGTMCSMN